MVEGLSTSMQESVLTLICLDNEQGQIAASLIDTELLVPPYDDIARRAIEYRKRYKEAPGEAHLDDLFDHVLSDPKNKKAKLYQNVLGSILDIGPKLNPEYTLSRLNHFMRRQNLQASCLEACERFVKGGDDELEDAEAILANALKFKPQGLDRGMYLGDKKGIEFLTQYSGVDFKLGIEQLDKRGVGLTRGEVLCFMAPPKRGKTWFCIHAGVMVLMQGGKVLHVSLEMKDQRIIPRYLRRTFAIAKRDDKYRNTFFEFDKLERLIGWDSKLTKPELNLKDPKIERKIASRMDKLGTRLNRLHFKAFPTSRLTMPMLAAYMDNLEASDGFVPDGLILDYPKLMKLRRNVDLRIGLGEQFEELRGFCDERKMFGLFPSQTNRSGEDDGMLTAANIGEDYSIVQTADALITYNQTKAEKQLKLARLYVDKARADEDGYSVLITQDYESGIFCRESAYMPNDYYAMLKGNAGEEDDHDTQRSVESRTQSSRVRSKFNR